MKKNLNFTISETETKQLPFTDIESNDGAIRHGGQPIAYRSMCRLDMWWSAWVAVVGDSWCA